MDMIENNLVPTPGADSNQSLGALAQMQQMRQQLQGQYDTAQAKRGEAQTSLDEYYQNAIDALKKPVQDNTWLHLALGALQPHMPWESGVLRGAQAATAESERMQEQNRQNALLANKLGGEWQKTRMGEFRDEADKLLAQLGQGRGFMNEQAKATNAFARQASTLYTQQLEAARRQAEAKTDISPEERAKWIRDTAAEGTRIALKRLAPIYAPAGVDVNDEMINAFMPSLETAVTGAETGQTAAQQKPQGLNVIPERLPKEASDEVNRLISRLQANPNPELHRKTLERLKVIQSQYPQAQPSIAELPSFGVTPQPAVPPLVGGKGKETQTIAEMQAEAAGMKTKAEELAKSATPGEKIIYETYDKLKDLPTNVATWNHALQEWDKSKSEFGQGAEALNAAKSFLNNRLGLDLSPDKVASAQAFGAAMDRYAAAQLRQTDSQPALKQLEMLRKAIGTLENDPNAVPVIIQHLQRLAEIQAEGHNSRVKQASEKGMQSYFDLNIPVPPIIKKFGNDPKTGRRVAKYSDGTIKYVGE